ncbi:uncharacterized protein CANTADRAFT_26716 [Suhomyces tanzawaensis NRRL Y-17324]|uniref:Uncharacterized protein n=1 Tax=Suhomyces tanzawaensis NRRL Y-17324 TaxID=984487 RepID=A0A1E4SGX5_9ASCO|nr:uncharacterized protein CANTADRAFT_26716 [Suhomyces tanzawaensis NRRL Y-17324]ODV78769.1 hypothetical protein CANTADRAFT_26716 [Suhomyces tanzawaensis NRRL Y-17324]
MTIWSLLLNQREIANLKWKIHHRGNYLKQAISGEAKTAGSFSQPWPIPVPWRSCLVIYVTT